MNPRNLTRDIRLYGYSYNLKNQLLITSIILCIFAILGKLMGLTIEQIAILFLLIALGIPKLILNSYKNMFEQKRFMDVSNYAEQMLYSFKRKSKVLNALEDTSVLFPDGLIGETILRAIDYINHAITDGNVYVEAFDIIEKEYGCDMIERIHSFMNRVEINGGEYETSIEILIVNRNKWVSRVLSTQKEKQLIKRNVSIGVVLSLLVIVGTGAMVPKDLVDIHNNIVAQISSLCILVANFWLWLFVQCKLSSSWINSEMSVTKEQIERYYDEVTNGKGNYRKKLSKKRLRREVEKAFPDWMLGLTLLLQVDNVQMSIRNSIEQAPIVLREELQLLQDKIESNPMSIDPYLEFYEILNIHEIQSAMRMLYSMSQNGGEDMTKQIHALVERNVELQDQSEKLKVEDYLAGMGFCVLVPMIIGCGKMLVDMSLLMYGILCNAQSFY